MGQQHRPELLRQHRPAEQEALRIVAGHAAELVGLPALDLATSAEDLAWWLEAQADADGGTGLARHAGAGPVLDSDTVFARADGGVQHVRRSLSVLQGSALGATDTPPPTGAGSAGGSANHCGTAAPATWVTMPKSISSA